MIKGSENCVQQGKRPESQVSEGQHWLPAGCSESQTPGALTGLDRQRPNSQLCDAGLAHRGRDGFDRCAKRVHQLGHLARALSLPAFLCNEAGQGVDIRVEGRLVRHC